MPGARVCVCVCGKMQGSGLETVELVSILS